jgi:hypothetical protein
MAKYIDLYTADFESQEPIPENVQKEMEEAIRNKLCEKGVIIQSIQLVCKENCSNTLSLQWEDLYKGFTPVDVVEEYILDTIQNF